MHTPWVHDKKTTRTQMLKPTPDNRNYTAYQHECNRLPELTGQKKETPIRRLPQIIQSE